MPTRVTLSTRKRSLPVVVVVVVVVALVICVVTATTTSTTTITTATTATTPRTTPTTTIVVFPACALCAPCPMPRARACASMHARARCADVCDAPARQVNAVVARPVFAPTRVRSDDGQRPRTFVEGDDPPVGLALELDHLGDGSDARPRAALRVEHDDSDLRNRARLWNRSLHRDGGRGPHLFVSLPGMVEHGAITHFEDVQWNQCTYRVA